MRLVVLSLLAVSLAGCSGGSGMSAFLVTPGDVPADCRYAMEDDFDFYDEIRDDYGWERNPGAFDAADAFGFDGEQTPRHALLAILACDENLVISWVFAFDSDAIAQQVAEESAYCGQEWGDPTFVRGNLVGQFEMNGDWAEGSMDPVIQRLETRLAVDEWCA